MVDLLPTKFDLSAESLVLRRDGPAEFLVFMANEESTIHLANSNDSPADNGTIRLYCRHWTHFVQAPGAVLPNLVDVDIHGILAHVWEVSTAEHLLNPFSWIREVHDSTRARENYFCFHVKAGCFVPNRLPPRRHLVIVEPPTGIVENPPVKRALVYPVRMTVLSADDGVAPPPLAGAAEPPPNGGHDSANSISRWCRCTSSSSMMVQTPASGSAHGMVGPPVSDGPGSYASRGGHMAVAVDAIVPPPVMIPETPLHERAPLEVEVPSLLADDSSPELAAGTVSGTEGDVPVTKVQTAAHGSTPKTDIKMVGPTPADDGPSVTLPTLMSFSVLEGGVHTGRAAEDPMQPLCEIVTFPCTASS